MKGTEGERDGKGEMDGKCKARQAGWGSKIHSASFLT